MEGEFTTYDSSMQSAHVDCFRAGFGVAGSVMVTSGRSLLLTGTITLSIYWGSGLKIVRYFCRSFQVPAATRRAAMSRSTPTILHTTDHGRAIVSTSPGSWFGFILGAYIFHRNATLPIIFHD